MALFLCLRSCGCVRAAVGSLSRLCCKLILLRVGEPNPTRPVEIKAPGFRGRFSTVSRKQAHLLGLVEDTLADLEEAGCIELGDDGGGMESGGRGTAGDEVEHLLFLSL